MSRSSLSGLADLLVRHRLATLEGVWALTLADARRALRLLQPSTSTPPSADALAALMQTFPDTHDTERKPDDPAR